MQDKCKRPTKKSAGKSRARLPATRLPSKENRSHKPKSIPPSSWQKKDSPQTNQSAPQGSKSDPRDHLGAWRLEWLGKEAGCIEGDVRAPDSHYSYGQFAVSAQIDRQGATILFRRHKVDGGVCSLWGGSRFCPRRQLAVMEIKRSWLCCAPTFLADPFPRPQSLRGPS